MNGSLNLKSFSYPRPNNNEPSTPHCELIYRSVSDGTLLNTDICSLSSNPSFYDSVYAIYLLLFAYWEDKPLQLPGIYLTIKALT